MDEPGGSADRQRRDWDSRLDALGLTTTVRRDSALAILVAAITAGPLFLPGISATVAGLLVAQAAVLSLRRVRPVWCLGAVLALQIGLAVAADPGEGIRGAALAIAVYTCGALMSKRRSLMIAGLAAFTETVSFVVLSAIPAALDSTLTASPPMISRILVQIVLSAILYGGAAALGRNTTIRRRYTEMVELRATEAAENLRVRTDAALAAERTRMARELHDVAAHQLTTLIVQATVVERMLDRDPEAVRRSAVAIRTEGKSALQNLRLVVGALREAGPAEPGLPDGGAPVPGLVMIENLVAGHAATQMRPKLIVSGRPVEFSEAADLTLYRVAQEALSNARDHAPGAAVTIKIDHRAEGSVLEVHNGPASARGVRGVRVDRRHRGFGLIGMRERAGLIGASLAAGPTPDGGWSVKLTIPRTAGRL
ncbi:sensor histidine kinase [Actinoplanes friuliensis]|uniref:histidine kinase n=1 Tax=Actinoplanes friuliensis DSM 7358 TaxID=1246995 RepID=U5VUV4_9ACTN|nr:histidine kinase [Actinoplanes friuliensis]AGZ40773.1 histidine kinase-, DNA gyrase B-, and HSP90-like ATPase family protein [Actinoplanes friuliensis DSM 7358]